MRDNKEYYEDQFGSDRPDLTGSAYSQVESLSDLDITWARNPAGEHEINAKLRRIETQADVQQAAQDILATIRKCHARRVKPLIDSMAWSDASEMIYLALEGVDAAVDQGVNDQIRVSLQHLRSEVNALVDHVLALGGR